jgi:FtsH-binding integral membrane protein
MVINMSEFNRPGAAYTYSDGTALNAYVRKVFALMGIGLGVTAAVAFFGYMSLVSGGIVAKLFLSSSAFTWILVLAELGIAFALSLGISRFSTGTCTGLFMAYSVLTGLTFSFLPLEFGVSTVFSAFLFAAVLFICCTVIGYTTNVDLTKFSGLMMGALLALVVTTVISIFVPVLRNSLFISYAGLLIFLAITAFDMQKIKSFYYGTGTDGTIRSNLAVYSAFQLYLDFINIFIYILRIMGRNRD